MRRAEAGAVTQTSRFILTAATLLVVAVAWTGYVIMTIPAGTGEGDVGPRAFPLSLGIALAALSLIGIAKAIYRTEPAGASAAEEPEADAAGTAHWPVLLIFLHILAYGYLMQRIGFVLSTMLVVASVMLVCVRDRSILRVAGMSVGVAFACWLIFGKILGVYLATGSWINLG